MLGVIADDFTGATDVADVLVDRGFRTTLLPSGDVGAPPGQQRPDALVVAAKTRTAPVRDAVQTSLDALENLRTAGCSRILFKYCSTFDSTPEGNIGPVIEALATAVGQQVTVATPAYPAARRTVFQGHLFVGDQLLSESPMRHHPLTPMTDSDLRRWLRPQTSSAVAGLPLEEVRRGAEAVRTRLSDLAAAAHPTIVVADAVDDDDLAVLADAVSDSRLLTGSAGLATGLSGPHPDDARTAVSVPGRRVVLCGSASAATRRQVAIARELIPTANLDLQMLARDGERELRRLVGWLHAALLATDATSPVMVYATGPEQDAGRGAAEPRLAARIEWCLAELAADAVEHGARQLLVAGGETSGAVVERLGIRRLQIGAAIAQGVPWTLAVDDRGRAMNLALKSGNFGSPNIFLTAWSLLDRPPLHR